MPERQLPDEVRAEIDQSNKEVSPEVQELSPDVLKLVMDKVQDINTKGIAYHATSPKDPLKRFDSVLQNGILGSGEHKSVGGFSYGKDEDRKATWLNDVKENKAAALFFNIVGRNMQAQQDYIKEKIAAGGTEIGHNYYAGTEATYDLTDYKSYGRKISMTFIFDLSRYSELPIQTNDEVVDYLENQKQRSFVPAMITKHGGTKYPVDEDGKIAPSQEYGFILSFRVAPRDLQGIVLKVRKKVEEADLVPRVRKSLYYDKVARDFLERAYAGNADATDWDTEVEKLVSHMETIDKDKPERLLPIYNTKGDLLWPKKMSYSEVQEFVTERDKEKTE